MANCVDGLAAASSKHNLAGREQGLVAAVAATVASGGARVTVGGGEELMLVAGEAGR
jgi:hypothetical protein